ncbi:MAG: calcium-binding protein, partial [Microcoleus sp. T1-bin1]|nr:calcium-binding protein [Microcoleus sp. T1-bin1]
SGDLGNNTLAGEAGNDNLYGGKDNDALLGGTGNDFLYAKEGNDILSGVDGTAANPGLGEVDTLVGAEGNDTFLLGDATKFYYNDGNDTGTGAGDYALIVGFNPIEDIIQLQGAPSTYQLGDSPAGLPAGTAIFKKTNGADELIAIVQSVSFLAIDSTSLRFV